MILYAEPEGAGLPSFDADSLAAISYLSIVAPDSFSIDRTASGSILCTGVLPSLHDLDADAWIGTFDDIVIYLKQSGLDADDSLSAEVKANAVAYSCLIVNKARDLTALYLYAYDENYTTFTRRELGNKLRFPLNYTSATSRHKEALQRVESLGIDIPSLTGPRDIFGSVKKSDLKHKKHMIRLQGMADDLYSITETMLSNTQFLLGNKPTSFDCLVFGHLAIHLFPSVPNPFLATTLKASYPRTWKYLIDFKTKIFDGSSLTVAPAMKSSVSSALRSIWYEVTGFNTVKQSQDSDDASVAKAKDAWRAKATFASSLVVGLVAFLLINGIIVIDLGDNEEIGDDFMSSEAYNAESESESEAEDDDSEVD